MSDHDHNDDGQRRQPPPRAGMHDLGRHRRALDHCRRRAPLARPGRLRAGRRSRAGLTFLQISDSHVGFDKPANPNALGTLEEAIGQIKAMPEKPSFMIHTGDITPSVEGGGVRQRRPHHLAGRARRALRARRARFHRRGRQALSRALRQGHQGRRLVQLRRQRRALHRPRQRRQPQGRRSRQSRRRAARMAGGRPQGPLEHRRRSSCSRTSRCGRSIRTGAGAPTTARTRSTTSSASAR